jgi:hypothetical protein
MRASENKTPNMHDIEITTQLIPDLAPGHRH